MPGLPFRLGIFRSPVLYRASEQDRISFLSTSVKKVVKKLLCILVILLLLLYLLYRLSDLILLRWSEERLSEIPHSGEAFLRVEDHDIYTIIQQSEEDTTLYLYVHGAPGDWSAFSSFLEDQRSGLSQVVYDRPGYGSTGGSAVKNFDDQANVLISVISSLPIRPVIITHSYGGPIGLQAAITHPDAIAGVVLIAPVVDPETEPIWWVSRLAYVSATKWLFTESSRVAAVEKMHHIAELDALRSQLEHLSVPVLHLHAIEDRIAPYEGNRRFIEQHVADSLLTFHAYPGGHMILWSEQASILKHVEAWLTTSL